MNKLKSKALKMGLPFAIGVIAAFMYQWFFNTSKCPKMNCKEVECPKQEPCKTAQNVCVPCKDCKASNTKYCKEHAMKHHAEYSRIMRKLYDKTGSFTVLSEEDLDGLFDDIDAFIALYKKVTGIDIELKLRNSRKEEKERAKRYLQHLIDTSKHPDKWEEIKAENIEYRKSLSTTE